MMILAILVTLVVPRLPELTSTRLQASADRLATLMTFLQDEAALRGRVYRLTLDFDRQRYDVAVQAPYAEGEIATGFVEQWDPYAKGADLPQGVALAAVETASGLQTAGQLEMLFVPEGSPGEVVVTLRSDDEEATVLYDGATGRARVEDAEDRT